MNDCPPIVPRVFKMPDGKIKVTVVCGAHRMTVFCLPEEVIGIKEQLCAEMAEEVGYNDAEDARDER